MRKYSSFAYLDGGVQRGPVLLFEAGSDVQHVHLAPRHHNPHQSVVIGPSALYPTKLSS